MAAATGYALRRKDHAIAGRLFGWMSAPLPALADDPSAGSDVVRLERAECFNIRQGHNRKGLRLFAKEEGPTGSSHEYR